MYAFCVLECMLRPPPEKETGGKTHERKSWSLDRLRASGDAAGECGSCSAWSGRTQYFAKFPSPLLLFDFVPPSFL